MALRYAHPAIDHLRDTAGRIDGTFTPHRARRVLSKRLIRMVARDGIEPPTRGFSGL